MTKKIIKKKISGDVVPIIGGLIEQFDLHLEAKTKTLIYMAEQMKNSEVSSHIPDQILYDAKLYGMIRQDFRDYFADFF